MNYQIHITGTGTREEIAAALRTLADAIHHPTSMGYGMNLSIDNVTWEDATLCTQITPATEEDPEEPPTDVVFYMETGNGTENPTPLAVFVNLIHGNENDNVVCYSHVGQHGPCSPEYVENLPKATPEQYADLKRELEQIGYNLNVIQPI